MGKDKISRIFLGNCTNQLLREIADPSMKRRDVAQTCRLAIETHYRAGDPVDWRAVNAAIVARWSKSALEWIKTQAHSGECFAARASSHPGVEAIKGAVARRSAEASPLPRLRWPLDASGQPVPAGQSRGNLPEMPGETSSRSIPERDRLDPGGAVMSHASIPPLIRDAGRPDLDAIKALAERIELATVWPIGGYEEQSPDRQELRRLYEKNRASHLGFGDSARLARTSWVAERIAEFVAGRDAEVERLRVIVDAAKAIRPWVVAELREGREYPKADSRAIVEFLVAIVPESNGGSS